MNLRIFQIDAFTSEAFGGNPAAVMPLDCWLEDDLLQAIVVGQVFVENGAQTGMRNVTTVNLPAVYRALAALKSTTVQDIERQCGVHTE